MQINKFLPVGTVVLLKDAKKRVMITGYLCQSTENNQLYDYSGCMFPEGIVNAENTLLFNHDQIVKLYHLGLVDEEFNEVNKALLNS